MPPTGPLYVLLLDSLNTQMNSQMYVREQLEEYLKRAVPGTRIAIFGLGTELSMIQGFTSDLGILKSSFDNSLMPRSSPLMDDPMGSGSAGKGSPKGVQQAQNQMRIDYTLQAMNNLARYLSAFPRPQKRRLVLVRLPPSTPSTTTTTAPSTPKQRTFSARRKSPSSPSTPRV